MKNLKNKLNKTGGFTLVEMLIVVAIIAILVAVSIPLVSSSLEKAREATDRANERAAKAEAAIIYLMGNGEEDDADYLAPGATMDAWIYNAVDGKLEQPTTGSTVTYDYGQCTTHKNGYLMVTVDGDTGDISLEWSVGETPHYEMDDDEG